MKYLTLVAVVFLFLQGCATTSPYHPADNRGYGYRETQLSDNQYRIDFKAWDIERGKAVNYAMLRAAEFTLEKGFDWFEIVDRQSDTVQPRASSGAGFSLAQHRHVERNCGVMGCRTRMSEPYSSFGMGIEIGGRDRSEADILLEIIMGKGVRPDAKRVYSASELVENLRKALAMEPPA